MRSLIIPPTDSPGPIDPDKNPPDPPSDWSDYEEEGLRRLSVYNPTLDENLSHRHPGSPTAH